jgi:ATP-dependent helicase/nuclease subunit A
MSPYSAAGKSPALAAFEHNGVLVSRQRFYEIACDPARSVAVEACAGAGKTWMLVSRMVRALLDGANPQDLLAITFTKKAAGEMRQRLHDWLLQFACATDAQLRLELRTRGFRQDPTAQQLLDLRQLHAVLLGKGRTVQIRTFHSWFASLLRTAPLAVLQALGLPTTYELLENDKKAVALVWRRFQTRVAKDPAARADYLDAVSTFGRHQTQKALESALSKRVEFVLADTHGVVDASVMTFAQQFADFAGLDTPQQRLDQPVVQQRLWDVARILGASTLVTCTKAATALERALTAQDAAGIVDALTTQKGTARKFSDKLVGLETVQQAQELLQRVAQAQSQHAAWLHQQRMTRLARGLLQDYAQLKREQGWIDMGDLERAALTLMSDPDLSGWVQERLDARVRHLLIDEFQDTNPLQWQALKCWLEGYAGAGQAPSVFIVGDPKQSIYRFRRAEPQVFKAAKAFVVEGLGGDLLSCDHTRRNAPVIIDLVNQTMGQAQDEDQFDGYRVHTTESDVDGQVLRLPRILRAAAGEGAGAGDGTTTWRDSLTAARTVTEETRKTLECRQAAQWLAQQLTGPNATLQAKDIMVLARKRERLSLMQVELAALRIPAQQPEKNELCDMPEVQDIVALLDVLVSPRHDLSLARALKSPVFGISDADLVQLVLRQRVLRSLDAAAVVSWWDVLQDGRDLPASLAEVGPRLALWKQWLDSLPPHDALSAIYQDADVLARYAISVPDLRRESVLANLQAVLAAALQVDGGRYTTAYALVRALRAGGIAAPVRADAGAVRLLTVHGAKGLEAPLVLLLDTDSEAQKSETMAVLVQWPGEDAHPQRFIFLASETKPPACAVHALEQEQAARKREELNALYVAMTRAKQLLVVSSLEPHSKNPQSWWQRLHSLAQDVPALGLPEVAGVLPTAPNSPQTYLLKVLQYSVPKVPLSLIGEAQAAINTVADSADPDAQDADTLDSRIGQAMHRLLEWVPNLAVAPPESDASYWSAEQLARVAQEFVLDAAQVLAAQHMSHTILQGQGAWAWDTGQIGWHGVEVAMVHRGRLVRLDRLVQHRHSQEWWVLDYKSNATPQTDPALCAQLAQYRSAVARAYPGQTVRAAFLTAQGALIEPAARLSVPNALTIGP